MKAIVQFAKNITLEIDERDEMETLSKAIVLANPRRQCNECGNTEGFYLTSNKDKEGNVYINVKCPKCGARSKLGQYKAGGYFWHDYEKYEPPANTAQERLARKEPNV
jgi:RNase P subunit RPR2